MSELDWTIPSNFDCNILEIFKNTLDSGIKTGKEILGCSDLPYCCRKNIIRNLHGVKIDINNKMLFGMMYETLLYQRDTLKALIIYLNKILQLKLPSEVSTTKEDYWEIMDGFFIRLHPDIYTNQYTIEIKTTAVYKRDWTQQLAPYQIAQENFYIGYYKQPYGFLHKLNLRAFIATIKDKHDGDYWPKLWREYGYFLPIYFDKDFYELLIERAKFLFNCIESKEIMISGPEFVWECAYCPEEVKKRCKNPIIKDYIETREKCVHCGEPIVLTKKASGEFSALPLKRNGVYYHGNDIKNPERWKDCRQAAIDAWEYDEVKESK